MQQISTIANSQLDKIYKPIANRNNSQLVDQLLSEYRELITPAYKKWFAKRFYSLSSETILKAASEARADTRTTPQQLFAYLVGKEYSKVDINS